MLVLTRKSHEQIQIGDNITITILRVKGGTIRVGIDAPRNVSVLRKELEGKPAKNDKTQVEAVVTDASVAVAAPTTRRRTMEGTASILAGGKMAASPACPANNPLRSRMARKAAPLASYVASL